MIDPYVYPHTDTLKNIANIQDEKKLSCMEAEYTSLRLAELVTERSASYFDFSALCDMHYYIFQDIYDWAGKIRVINIEKAEAALGGLSIEYSYHTKIEKDATAILEAMNQYFWETATLEEAARNFSGYLAELWRTHPYREGNTRTIVTFCSQFIESRGFYIDSGLFKDNAQYMRTALVAASAVFTDLGDKRKSEYLDEIVFDALIRGKNMKDRIAAEIRNAGYKATEDRIRKIVNWNRAEWHEHNSEEIRAYLLSELESISRGGY